MIEFYNVRYKNFLSSGNTFTEINLNNTKTTLIVGKNGAGKSTMADAITFALFGKAFRNINKPQLVSSINQKEMVVEIEFRIGSHLYKVIRGIKPNIFEIYQNGNMINQDAASRDYQEVLEKNILKMSFKTFCQVVILGSASFIPFMGLPTPARRKIIEDILDLEIFSAMNVRLKEKVLGNANEVKDTEYEMKMIDQKINIQREHLDNLLKDVDSLLLELNSKITTTTDTIVELNMGIMENNATRSSLLENISDDPAKLANRVNKLNTLSTQLNRKISKINEEIEFYETNDVCPTCHQDISPDFKHDHVGLKHVSISETREGIDKLNEEMTKAKDRLIEVNSVYELCTELNVENTIAISSISAYENSINQFRKEIDKLKEKKEGFKADSNSVAVLEREKVSVEKRKIKLLSERELYNISLVMLKDSGIKARIIKQYIPIINKYINKYLAAMDFFISFELDENFNETIKSRFRDDFSYASFSEGEKARISLCVLFTWRTVAKLRNSASTNLLIFDEIFDGSLDGDGSEEFMKILEIAAPDTNVFVISHKTEAMLDRFDRVLRFEKVKNFSTIVE